MPTEMTMRDHFAAAALTGLLAQGDDGSFSEESYARAAYRWADAMLRERGNHIADASKIVKTPKETQDSHPSTPQVPPVPRTPQSDRLTEWERHGSHRWGLGVASDLYDLECRVAAMEKGSAATPAMHATPPQGIEPREGTEPVACAVMLTDAERDLLDTLRRSGYLLPHGAKIIDGLLERLGGER